MSLSLNKAALWVPLRSSPDTHELCSGDINGDAAQWHGQATDTRGAGSIPGSGRSLEKEMATHSSILAWEIPWTEELGRLQSIGLQESDMSEHHHHINSSYGVIG